MGEREGDKKRKEGEKDIARKVGNGVGFKILEFSRVLKEGNPTLVDFESIVFV